MNAARRHPVVGASVLTGILALSAFGTTALTAPGASALAVFDRPPTAAEIARAEQLDQDSLFSFEQAPEARLLLAAPSDDAPDAQEVWALRLAGDDASPDGAEVCLLTTRRGTEQEFLAGCLPSAVIERRGFVPLDEPRPFLFVDGEEFVIEWGPTGDARLIPRPTPPAAPPDPEEQGADG